MIRYLAPQAIGAVGKWESCFWISTALRNSSEVTDSRCSYGDIFSLQQHGTSPSR